MDKLRSTFSFREWHSGAEKEELTYCGAKITKIEDNHWKIHHTDYLGKQKPISFPKERQQKVLPVTEGERIALREASLVDYNGQPPRLLHGFKPL